MTEINRKLPALNEAQVKALKQKLRSLRWQPDAVMREIFLIQNLRRLGATDSKD